MSNKNKKWFLTLVVLQLCILFGIAGSHYYTLHNGEKILLKTEPVDPRDLFYGDYVTLNYDISRIPMKLWESDGMPNFNEKVYVVLEETKNIYKAKSVYGDRPDVKENEVVLKAVVKGVDDRPGELFLLYGIERYYVEEGTGKAIEDDRPEYVSVRVAPWGQVTIEQLENEAN